MPSGKCHYCLMISKTCKEVSKSVPARGAAPKDEYLFVNAEEEFFFEVMHEMLTKCFMTCSIWITLQLNILLLYNELKLCILTFKSPEMLDLNNDLYCPYSKLSYSSTTRSRKRQTRVWAAGGRSMMFPWNRSGRWCWSQPTECLLSWQNSKNT